MDVGRSTRAKARSRWWLSCSMMMLCLVPVAASEATVSEPPPTYVLPAAEILLALGAASAWYWPCNLLGACHLIPNAPPRG